MTDRTCSIEGCDAPFLARGFCSKHYQRWKVHGDPLGSASPRFIPCSVAGCDERANARGLCGKHYQQSRREGTLPPLVAIPAECSVDGCERKVYGRGWCATHWRWWRQYGDPLGTGLLEPIGAVRPYGTKWCRKCATFLPIAQFYVGKKGHESPCKECRAVREKEARKRKPARSRSSQNRKRRARMHAAKSERYTAVEIAERDGWRCQICGKRIGRSYRFPHPRSLSIDHIIPIGRGGDDVKVNCQAAHFRCNVSKGARGVDQLRLIG